jgi:pimeloyl-ACP methyl ester carboxylesterase
MSLTAPTIAFVVALGVLGSVTLFGIAWIEASHPPAGPFVEVESVRLHIAEMGLARDAPGAEPAVVLIHGASGNMEDMRLALGETLAASYRVVLIDRPGHGWSSRPADASYASPERQAELVAKALEQLGVGRAVLVGHSWGGALATAYALAFPDRTAGLVLLSAVTHPWPADPGWYNNLALLPGPLFLRTLVYPLSFFLADVPREPCSSLRPCPMITCAVPPSHSCSGRRHSSPTRVTLRCSGVSLSRRCLATPVCARRRSSLRATATPSSRRTSMRALSRLRCRAPNWFLSKVSDTCRTMPRRPPWQQRSTN